jgi:hypothetical protein
VLSQLPICSHRLVQVARTPVLVSSAKRRSVSALLEDAPVMPTRVPSSLTTSASWPSLCRVGPNLVWRPSSKRFPVSFTKQKAPRSRTSSRKLVPGVNVRRPARPEASAAVARG